VADSLKVLLVASDPDVEAALRAQISGCCPGAVDITRAGSEEAGRVALQVEPFDCALVTGDSGAAIALSFCAIARRTSVAPTAVLLLLEEPDEELALRAVEVGADDAVLRPDLGGPAICPTLRRAVARRLREHELEQRIEGLEQLATIDPLTGLLNRRGTEAALKREQMLAVRRSLESHFVLVDVDDFKSVNDRYGYQTGDAVLQMIGRVLLETVRRSDHVGRIGGDEFLVLMPGCKLGEALKLAERVRSRLASTTVELESGELAVRVSLGVAGLPMSVATVTDAVALVSSAVQRSKRRGKNQVTVEMETISASWPRLSLSEAEADFEAGDTMVLVQSVARLTDAVPVAWWIQPVGAVATATSGSGDPLSLTSPDLVERDLGLLHAAACALGRMDGCPHYFSVLPETLRVTAPSELREILERVRGSQTLGFMLADHHLVGDPADLADAMLVLRDLGFGLALRGARFGSQSLEALALLRPTLVAIPVKHLLGPDPDAGQLQLLRRQVRVVRSLGAEVAMEGVVDPTDKDLAATLGITLGIGSGAGPMAIRRGDE